MHKHHKIYQVIPAALLLVCFALPAAAQRTVSAAQYFFNQYLANPAMAGRDSSLNLMVSYNRQFDNLPGAPVNTMFSADYNMGKRVGLGVNGFSQNAGPFHQFRGALTYAYHLPVGARGQRLSFGISAAVVNNRFTTGEVDGDHSDPSLAYYNDRGLQTDGDFGVVYAAQSLTLQAAVPSIRNNVTKETYYSVDRPTLFTAASYKFYLGEGEINSIEPKLCYTSIRGNKDVIDAGVEVKLVNNIASVFGMYHSTQNFTVGIGADILSRVKLMASFTPEGKNLRNYTDGIFSINLLVSLFPGTKE
ncbi:PorP/SprF family type IX secretion system membrane protein [Chitinophaga sp. YIM B06452]|uniref:PorP/SprF family type IX secretion system membrane protein n=1 Tax=Chitinophaga sp. YIM B06452 TaxID=3082158 RepID=UPI0031FE8107